MKENCATDYEGLWSIPFCGGSRVGCVEMRLGRVIHSF